MEIKRVRLTLFAAIVAVLQIAAFSGAGGPSYYGMRGMQSTMLARGAVVEPSEKIVVRFPDPVSALAFKSGYRIEPEAASRSYIKGYGTAIELTFRKVPGTEYTISGPGGVSLTLRTASVPIPAPLRDADGPYRYGVLAHPFPFSLGDIHCSGRGGYGGVCTLRARSMRQVQAICDSGARNVRIDYPASQILNNGKVMFPSPDFTKEDAIADELARCGITELPIVLQYAAGPVLTGGKGGSSPMASAQEYANLARVIADHITGRFPQMTRIELMNEPNNHGWGSFPVNGDYTQRADESGATAALYLKAAYAAVKSAHPQLTIVGPAIADGGHSTDPRAFLETLYANGCRRGTCWDVLSVHNYDWENPSFNAGRSRDRFDVYKDLQEIAARHGDKATHVMLTEWGFSTALANPDAFDPSVQAAYIAIGFNKMLADPTVDGVTYVNVYNAGHDFWANTALLENDFSPKPGYDVFRRFAKS